MLLERLSGGGLGKRGWEVKQENGEGHLEPEEANMRRVRGWSMRRGSGRLRMMLGGFWGWFGLNLVCSPLLRLVGEADVIQGHYTNFAADLLILGLGKEMRPLSPKTRQFVNSLGIRIDIQDTRNAAAQFNLLATERGVGSVAAALVPLGWREGLGIRPGRD